MRANGIAETSLLHERITSRREPFAVERIRKALRMRGVEAFSEPTPGVRMAEHSSQAEISKIDLVRKEVVAEGQPQQ